jgi:hypothetical protein
VSFYVSIAPLFQAQCCTSADADPEGTLQRGMQQNGRAPGIPMSPSLLASLQQALAELAEAAAARGDAASLQQLRTWAQAYGITATLPKQVQAGIGNSFETG